MVSISTRRMRRLSTNVADREGLNNAQHVNILTALNALLNPASAPNRRPPLKSIHEP